MSEFIHDKQVFSLLEVTLSIQKTIAERYQKSFWVKAEMNKLNLYSHSGHCYPELVEKADGKTIAQIKATLWKSDFLRINNNFLEVLKEPVKDGIKILFLASITFDPSHGLSLRIHDMDPSFSLGELEREKQQTISRLRQEGIYNQNKQLPLSQLPQRIAIVSVETSKGYSDYLKVLEHNPWGYKFFNFLFPALLQGDRSVASIMHQLQRIKKVCHHFDVVAIVRGGGGDVGLSSYNHYELAREICLFPIPVFTGIGHSTNETVAEMISFRNAITPTALADFLLQQFHNFSVPVKDAEVKIIDKAKRLLQEEKQKFQNSIRYFRAITQYQLERSKGEVDLLRGSLQVQSRFMMRRERSSCLEKMNQLKKTTSNLLDNFDRSLANMDKQVSMLDPINILKRGFSITTIDGKTVKSYQEIKTGDVITTTLADGQVISEVKTSNPTQP